jgi:hypothetical protein
MARSTINGIEYICTCGTIVQGSPYDVRIKTFNTNTGQMAAEINEQLIKNSPFDRTNNLIKEDCKKCGRVYKTQVRISESETIIKLCKCE